MQSVQSLFLQANRTRVLYFYNGILRGNVIFFSMWFIGSSGIYCMPNFLIFPLHTPELYEVWWDYSAVGV